MEALKCKICGGELSLDALNDLYLCQYCDSKFPRERPVHAMAAGVAPLPSAGAPELEALLARGLQLLERGDYARAGTVFRQAAQGYPKDYRGWWYLFACDTQNLTDIRPDKDRFVVTDDLAQAFGAAPSAAQPDLLQLYRAYAGQCRKRGCELEMDSLATQCAQIDMDMAALEARFADESKKYQKTKGVRGIMTVLSILLVALMAANFFRADLWLLLTVPLGLFGLFLLIGRREQLRRCDPKKHAAEMARLTDLKQAKQQYRQTLAHYVENLPATMEKLTVADVLNQKRNIA